MAKKKKASKSTAGRDRPAPRRTAPRGPGDAARRAEHRRAARAMAEALELVAPRLLRDVPRDPAADRLPVQSLLARCEALVSRSTGAHDPLRLFWFLPGTPGADLARALAGAPNTRLRHLRSALDPVLGATVPSAAGAAPQDERPGVAASRRAVWAGILTAAFGAVHEALGADGRRLVLSEEVGPHSLVPGRDDWAGRPLRAVMLVCHPRRAFEAHAAAAALADDPILPLDDICRLWLEVLESHSGIGILRLEDLAGSTADRVARVCAYLDLPPPWDLANAGPDPDAGQPGPAAPAAIADLVPGLDQVETDGTYARLCEALGYDPDMSDAAPAGTAADDGAAPAAPLVAAPEQAGRAAGLPDRRLLVCCHHKAGTNFLLKTLRGIGAALDLSLWTRFYDPEPQAWDICLHQHARIRDLMMRDRFRGLHVIRHPMALIYSAALYHETCTEPWVDLPLQRFDDRIFRAFSDRDAYRVIKAADASLEEKLAVLAAPADGDRFTRFDSGYEFDGRTYRQMLQEAPDMTAKLRFEMHSYSRGVILDMTTFPKDARFYTTSLESISWDPAMSALRQAFRHLGFRGKALQTCLDVAAKHTLWNAESLPRHATTGMSDCWKEAFTGPLEAEFRALFGWPEAALGYA